MRLPPAPAEPGLAGGHPEARPLHGLGRSFSGTFKSLSTATAEAKLPEDAGRFWSEHSDRAGLDSWTAALGVGQSERDFLGRWAAKGSSDTYVRTALRVVENLQRLAATKAREAYAGGPDHFGEEHLLLRLRDFLTKRGLEDDRAILLAEELRCCNYTLPVAGLTLAPDWARAKPVPEANTAEVDPLEEDDNEVLETLAEPIPEEDEVPWGYVISITRGGRHRKLHHVGSCRLIPGLDYKFFEVWRAELPHVSQLNSRCGKCFGTSALAPVEEVSGGESLTSSSETSGVEPAAGDPPP